MDNSRGTTSQNLRNRNRSFNVINYRSEGQIGLNSDQQYRSKKRSNSDINTSSLSKTDKLHLDLKEEEKNLNHKYQQCEDEIKSRYHTINSELSKRIDSGKMNLNDAQRLAEQIIKGYEFELKKLDDTIRKEKEELNRMYLPKINKSTTWSGQLQLSWEETWEKIKGRKS